MNVRGGGAFPACLLALLGAAIGSQAPAFTLQYMQNLQGQIDSLQAVVERFDASIAAYGYSRAQALDECGTATGLLHALCETYLGEIQRYERLTAHMAELAAADRSLRPLVLAQEEMRDVTRSTLKQFEPVLPATLDGLIYVAAGGLAGLAGFALVQVGAASLCRLVRRGVRP